MTLVDNHMSGVFRGRAAVRAPAITAAIVVAILSSSAPAIAQRSESHAYVDNGLNGARTCASYEPPAVGGSSATCTAPVSAGGVASASSSSDNATRTVTSSTALSQTESEANNSMYANSQAYSYQYSSIALSGSTSADDDVVFHFATPVFAGTALGDANGSAYWQLFFYDGTSGYSNAYTRAYGDGTISSGSTSDAQFTSAGVDFTIPFAAFASTTTLDYTFGSYTTAGNGCGSPCAAILSSSITATLVGVDITDQSGQRLASAAFNSDGTGTIDLTTTPEPSSLGLLGTGLISLLGVARKSRVGKA